MHVKQVFDPSQQRFTVFRVLDQRGYIRLDIRSRAGRAFRRLLQRSHACFHRGQLLREGIGRRRLSVGRHRCVAHYRVINGRRGGHDGGQCGSGAATTDDLPAAIARAYSGFARSGVVSFYAAMVDVFSRVARARGMGFRCCRCRAARCRVHWVLPRFVETSE